MILYLETPPSSRDFCTLPNCVKLALENSRLPLPKPLLLAISIPNRNYVLMLSDDFSFETWKWVNFPCDWCYTQQISFPDTGHCCDFLWMRVPRAQRSSRTRRVQGEANMGDNLILMDYATERATLMTSLRTELIRLVNWGRRKGKENWFCVKGCDGNGLFRPIRMAILKVCY